MYGGVTRPQRKTDFVICLGKPEIFADQLLLEPNLNRASYEGEGLGLCKSTEGKS